MSSSESMICKEREYFVIRGRGRGSVIDGIVRASICVVENEVSEGGRATVI